ncbi:MAG: DUF4350 domain-containing protein [Pyrinomonadaceae bacterium]|nr:DUF4350 domain-containing protein [Pyrinomonadaceae bacterium]
MKERLLIFGALIGLVILMIGLNAASYTQQIKKPDTELDPNRSTYNPGSTGTLAVYTLLAETGRPVIRWQLPPSGLFTEAADKPSTFVIFGPHRREFTEQETADLLRWVSAGGRLVVIDRMPVKELVKHSTEFSLEVSPQIEIELFSVDPANQGQMTSGTPAVKPAQPTVYTAGVNAVQPSRFASNIKFSRSGEIDYREYFEAGEEPADEQAVDEDDENYDAAPPPAAQSTPIDFYDPPLTGGEQQESGDTQPPPAKDDEPTTYSAPAETQTARQRVDEMKSESPDFKAPVVHIAAADRNILVDVPYGAGEIVFLSDPFIVSNGGISMADNAQLAVNVFAAVPGPIAFDEYHQGFGAGTNRALEYFSGTPVVAIGLQVIALIALVLYSRSRRFARPVPEPEPDRLSKLEYVGAMAELQLRTGAFDLAMENIYSDFRRRAARHFGVDNTKTTRREFALMIAERAKTDPAEMEELLRKCEDIVHGEPTNKREMIRLVDRIRDIEELLGLRRQGRARI